MNKKIDISKILAKGSAKQRALLYFNNIGEKNRAIQGGDFTRGKDAKGFLTDLEEDQLYKSFKTEAEIKLYTRFLKLDRAISEKLTVSMAVLFQYRETIASLSGYCLLYHGYTEFADNLSGLYFTMKKPEEKKTVLKYLEKHNSYLWSEIGPAEDPDKNGVRVLPGWDHPDNGKDPKTPRKTPRIRELLSALSKRAERQLSEAKSVVKAIRDAIKETGYKIDLYEERLDEIENDLKQDKAPLPKFSRSQTDKLLSLRADDPKERRRLEEIFGKNWLFPEYEKVGIEEKLYNHIFERLTAIV